MLNQACEVSFMVEWKMWKGYYIVMSNEHHHNFIDRFKVKSGAMRGWDEQIEMWMMSTFWFFSFKKAIHDQWGISTVILSPPTLPFYLQAVEMNIVTWHWWWMFVAICLSDLVGDTAPVVTCCQVSGQAEPYVTRSVNLLRKNGNSWDTSGHFWKMPGSV